MLKKFMQDEAGATAIEYGLLAAIAGTGIVGIGATFGDSLETGFSSLGTSFLAEAAF